MERCGWNVPFFLTTMWEFVSPTIGRGSISRQVPIPGNAKLDWYCVFMRIWGRRRFLSHITSIEHALLRCFWSLLIISFLFRAFTNSNWSHRSQMIYTGPSFLSFTKEHSLTLFRINCSQSSQTSTSLVYSHLFLAFTNFFE
jgi:hypothetical protein